jgi:hypothetical protein
MLRRALHDRLGMTLEAVRALPWYVHDSIIEELYEEARSENEEGGEGKQVTLGDDAALAALGVNMREVE